MSRKRQPANDLLVPADLGESAESLDFLSRIGEDVGVGRRRPAIAVEGGQIVENGLVSGRPLRGGDLRERLADEVAPAGNQQKRPGKAGPAGKVRIHCKSSRSPSVENAADVLAGI